MAHWLVKSEPDVYSWDECVARGKAGDAWTGVRNHQAKIHLNTMKKGDTAFFYHSGGAREIVGVEVDPGCGWGRGARILGGVAGLVALAVDDARGARQLEEVTCAVVAIKQIGLGVGLVEDEKIEAAVVVVVAKDAATARE